MPSPLPVKWPEIRRAAELGASYKTLASIHGVNWETIKKRADREQWLVPHRLQTRLAAQQEAGKSFAEGNGHGVSLTVPDSLFAEKAEAEKQRDRDKTELALAIDWNERKDQIRSLAWSIGEKSLSKVKQSGVMVTDAGDLTKIVKVMREAAGFNDQTPAFSLSIFGSDTPDAIDTIHEMPVSYAEPITDSDDWA